MKFTSEQIEKLHTEVRRRLTDNRFKHTLGVVNSAKFLGKMCLPDKLDELVCAAYLHDVTKELSFEQHSELFQIYNFCPSCEDLNTHAVLHAYSASFAVRREFAEFSTDDILSAVFNHTLGSPDMTVFDEIIFLADYIEETRKYESSVKVREFVYSNMRYGDMFSNCSVLHSACVKAIDYTLLHLIDIKQPINSKNILTRNALLSKI